MPRNVTVIQTTTSSSNVPMGSPGLLDRGYCRSYAAILKICQMLTLLIGFLCVRLTVFSILSVFCYFQVVTICFMIVIFIFYVINIFRFYRMLTCISWPLTELLHYAIGTILLLIASIVVAVNNYGRSSLIAGSVFGFIATFLCTLSMWLSHKVSFTAQSTGATL
ncbi:CKLF-like MARVEL transmembrane domain-containing protein 7 [Bombina bombina]|uniref:CKLF-like MARVEL transmembrane domain-containing protein 7 n=1 Tax=Bombina bombina TaxID=8345 RepID=UPI00235A5EB5|nr:CKLF-like MARVEL transmembrane domain-containing protein 7 [Bombina bombina]